MRYHCDVYKIGGVTTKAFDDLSKAKAFADKKFRENDTYKVKVWDLKKGDREPNRETATAWVYHLV